MSSILPMGLGIIKEEKQTDQLQKKKVSFKITTGKVVHAHIHLYTHTYIAYHQGKSYCISKKSNDIVPVTLLFTLLLALKQFKTNRIILSIALETPVSMGVKDKKKVLTPLHFILRIYFIYAYMHTIKCTKKL